MIDEELRASMERKADAYMEGFAIGYSSEGIPSFTQTESTLIAPKAIGFADGLECRRSGLETFSKPDWINKAQLGALLSLYLRSKTIVPNFPEFVVKACEYHDYIGIEWEGMFIGIERDGYTHS